AAGDGPVAVAVTGGHGELFVAQYDRPGLIPTRAVANLMPVAAAEVIDANLVVGSGAEALVAARDSGEAIDRLPSAADALTLPVALRSLPPSPLYARAPDARPIAA
ncbi:MAG: tRNA (adenosine(37)-N6)-threonylcarbamoyltransferase complex dimerization subunit type 1 TsaB, partial [Sphingomonas bacterium]|nr:tRNA (adenosine(37)-N6)-threonylcarbamoyltransferase complex dimerization subunit type 1 TsaB [Sphingomonas bacterium]